MTAEGETLRRRLYRPGAVEADIAAYLSVAVLEPASEEVPPAPPVRRRPRRRTVVTGAVLAVLIAAPVLVLQVARPEPPAAAGPSPLPTRVVAPATAAGFSAALARGDDAGLGRWWNSTAPFVEEHGSGDGTVLLPVAASGGGGRLTVLLVLGSDGTAGWSAARLVIHDDRTIHLLTERSAFGALRAGVPAIGRLDYTAEHRPMRLFIQAPTEARWGVAAVIGG